jgi:hypothetical protein
MKAMNTEKFVVTPKNGKYVNFHCNFNGTMAEAEEYAQKHNYGGGIDVFIPSIRVRNNKESRRLRD